MKFLVFIICLALFMFLFEKVLRSILGIQSKKIEDPRAKKIDLYGRIILVIVFILFLYPNMESKWYWLSFFIALYGFQGVLEWVYLRETKQHILTFIQLAICVVFVLNLDYIIDFLNM